MYNPGGIVLGGGLVRISPLLIEITGSSIGPANKYTCMPALNVPPSITNSFDAVSTCALVTNNCCADARFASIANRMRTGTETRRRRPNSGRRNSRAIASLLGGIVGASLGKRESRHVVVKP